MILVLLGWALAQEEPEPGEEVGPRDDQVSRTVIVYSRDQVEAAREEVIEDLEQMGYTKRIEKDGAVVMRHAQPWKGDVWLHDDGWMRIRRQPVRVEAPASSFGKRNSAGAWAGCVLMPFRCVRAGGQFVSRRKFMAVETRTAEAVTDEVAAWSDKVADYRVSEKVQGLPERLQALWDDGVPLEGETQLAGPPERKEALLDYWETRTDNPWGEAVRQAVENFLVGVVQDSPTPITEAELAAFNRRSRAARPLELDW